MPAPCSRLLGAFARDDRGNIAIIFALVLIPAIAVVGTGIDYGRMLKVRSQIQNAADAAAAVAVARADAGIDAVSQALRANLDANLPENLKGLPFKTTIGADRRSLDVTVEATVDTSLLAMVGIDSMAVEVSTTVAAPEPVPSAPDVPVDPRSPDGDLGRFARDAGASGAAAQPPAMTAAQAEELRRLQARLEAELAAALANAGGASGIDLGTLRGRFRRH